MDMESICFQIITCVGSAKSCYVESIALAKKGEIEKAREQIAEGDQFFLEGHHVHAELIGQEASGNPVPASILLIHAEDQLMSAETAKIYAVEFIELYEKLFEKGLA